MALGHRTVPLLIDFHLAFALSAELALIGVLSSFRLAPNTGQTISGHKPKERPAK